MNPFDFSDELLEWVRELARRELTPTSILRQLIARLGESIADRPTLVCCVSEAFNFREGEAYVIFHWFADGSGASDEKLDQNLKRKIEKSRAKWD